MILRIIVLLVLTCFVSSGVIKDNMKTKLLHSTLQWQDKCNTTKNTCGSSKSATWPLYCYNDESMIPAEIRLCSSVCENGRSLDDRDKCATFCSEYVQRCLPYQRLSNITTKAMVKPPSNIPSISEFPNVLDCFVPGPVCRELAHLKNTDYYPIACYLDAANVLNPDMESCWELCNSELTEKCHDFCFGYLRLCPDLKPYDKTTKMLDEEEWPFKKECAGITSSQCRNDRFFGAWHYKTNCFLDTSLLDPVRRSCEEVCGDRSSSNMDRCFYFCALYRSECLGITTTVADVSHFKGSKPTPPESRVKPLGEGLSMQTQMEDGNTSSSTELSTYAQMEGDSTSLSTKPSTHTQMEDNITSSFTKPSTHSQTEGDMALLFTKLYASRTTNRTTLSHTIPEREQPSKATMNMLTEDSALLLKIVGVGAFISIGLSVSIWCLMDPKKRHDPPTTRSSPGIRREETDSSHRWLLTNSAVCNATQNQGQGEQC